MEARPASMESRLSPGIFQAGEAPPPPAVPERGRKPRAPETPVRRRPGLY